MLWMSLVAGNFFFSHTLLTQREKEVVMKLWRRKVRLVKIIRFQGGFVSFFFFTYLVGLVSPNNSLRNRVWENAVQITSKSLWIFQQEVQKHASLTFYVKCILQYIKCIGNDSTELLQWWLFVFGNMLYILVMLHIDVINYTFYLSIKYIVSLTVCCKM